MTKKIIHFWIFSLVFFFGFNMLNAEEIINVKKGESKGNKELKADGCEPASAFQFLQINNVRTRINSGGDMWWDFDKGQYYIPANSTKTSMFASSLWIGGMDINGQLKLAAHTYRQTGNDFFTGPLTMDGTASVSKEVCGEWDKMFKLTKAEVKDFRDWYKSDNPDVEFPGYSVPASILNYPAHGDEAMGQSKYLAPFKDEDGDGEYHPLESGDYPYYDFNNDLCPNNFAGDPDYVPAETMESSYYDNYYGGILVDQVLKGDETIWWVFNDKGNIHSETGGDPIGLEIHAQAFAFTSNDQINNMSFYTYEVINRSTYVLTNTFFSPWADTDLGNATDDFVGCDVNRGLGYSYNGDDDDNGGPETYGINPPAIGIDFFQGPYIDPDGYDNPRYGSKKEGELGAAIQSCEIVSWDGTIQTLTYGDDEQEKDFLVLSEAINGVNFGNGIVDDERFGMRSFIFFNNDGSTLGNPSGAVEFYNYLQGLWRDGSTMKYGGDAYATGIVTPPVDCRFMFPDDSDPCNWGTDGKTPGDFNQGGMYWNEAQVGNNPADRRIMQVAGPFTLKPGAVNYITVGVPWARTTSGGPWASVKLLKIADDKCQALFDNCFKMMDGPAAPDMTFTELDKKFIVQLSNSRSSNNFKEHFSQFDPTIPKQVLIPGDTLFANVPDSLQNFYFEGYQIFQLRNERISLAQSRYDNNDVRLVAQFDKKDGVGRIINYKFDIDLNATTPVLEVDGADEGVQHSFTITRDLFPSSSDDHLVNYKKYYYVALAYGYNNYKTYDPENPDYSDGQREPYLAGRENIRTYTAIPHDAGNGTIINTEYGAGPEITRIEGQGNGGRVLDLVESDVEKLLAIPPLDTTLLALDTVNIYNSESPILINPTYKGGKGPIDVKVIDPLNIKAGTFTLTFKRDDDTTWFTFPNISGQIVDGEGDTAGMKTFDWVLKDIKSGKMYYSDTMIHYPYEKLFPELGISINISNVFYPGNYVVGELATKATKVGAILAKNNGLLLSKITYADSSKIWLDGVKDEDGFWHDWIRSGTNENDYASGTRYWDPQQAYEKMLGGVWAPYCLAAENKPQSSFTWAYPTPLHDQLPAGANPLAEIASVDIVYTSDKSKWTRCPVIEMCPEAVLAQGKREKFYLRDAPSVDKEGNPSTTTTISTNPDDPNYIAARGYGWFPGYAINIETGERLNMMFSEDSHLLNDNGRDMLFNPTSKMYKEFPDGSQVYGGKHYVYVMKSGVVSRILSGENYWPPYDAGKVIGNAINSATDITELMGPYESCMYVGMPMAKKDHEDEWLSNDVTMSIRIGKPYDRRMSNTHDVLSTNVNDEYPMYQFSLDNLVPTFNDDDQLEKDMTDINIVPNPYYGYSAYEDNSLKNIVKIVNLPNKCMVTIYNSNGMLIRKYSKDNDVSYIEWDLKNHAGIPIAGGMYLIHVKELQSGKEQIIKWFGALRIDDFNMF